MARPADREQDFKTLRPPASPAAVCVCGEVDRYPPSVIPALRCVGQPDASTKNALFSYLLGRGNRQADRSQAIEAGDDLVAWIDPVDVRCRAGVVDVAGAESVAIA